MSISQSTAVSDQHGRRRPRRARIRTEHGGRAQIQRSRPSQPRREEEDGRLAATESSTHGPGGEAGSRFGRPPPSLPGRRAASGQASSVFLLPFPLKLLCLLLPPPSLLSSLPCLLSSTSSLSSLSRPQLPSLPFCLFSCSLPSIHHGMFLSRSCWIHPTWRGNPNAA